MDVDYLPYIALCGLFPPKRNIIRNWAIHEKLFIDLVKLEGKVGIDHIMQALVLYFIRVHHDDLGKFASTFMKKLVDENVMTEKFLLEWFDKTVRLDKDSNLYDKKAEKKFRDLIEKFIEWLRTASSSSESDSSESDDGNAPSEEEEEEEKGDLSKEEQEAQKKLKEAA